MNQPDDSARRIAEYIRPVPDLSARIRDQFSATIAANRDLVDSLGRSLASFDAHAADMAALARSFRVPHLRIPQAAVSGVATEALAQFRAQTEEMHRRLTASFQPLLEFRVDLAAVPARTRDALHVLAANGWYLDLEMTVPFLWELHAALEAGDVGEVDEALCDYFEGRLDEIERTLTETQPRRAHLIRAAVGAHRRAEYALAIPVLMAQADGICKDRAQAHFFLRGERPALAAFVGQVASDSLSAAFLSMLVVDRLPIRASRDERDPDFSALNRHRVLHGEDVDYGTRQNSLRAVALVNYVAGVLSDPSG